MTKIIKISLLTASVLISSLSAIEITSNTDAINIAGKQRMFTQRMLKNYAMIGMNNTFGNPTEDLEKIISEFDESLISLENYTKSNEIKKSLENVKKLWEPVKKLLTAPPSKEKVEKLQIDLDALLKASDETTKLFTKTSKDKSNETINISGRQRMLSQRMASLYMLKVWDVKDPQFKTKLDDSMKLFKDSLNTLQNNSLNTDEINKLLASVKKSFMFFEVMNQKNSTKFIPTLIYKKSNDILKNMDSVTKQYVKIESK